MKVTTYALPLVLFALAAGAHAQQPATMRPCANMAGASAPAGGCGGPHGRWGSDYTPGWMMMTPEERQAHQQRMADMQTYAECKAYMDQHHTDMVARARERGMAMPARPRRDACASLPGKPAK